MLSLKRGSEGCICGNRRQAFALAEVSIGLGRTGSSRAYKCFQVFLHFDELFGTYNLFCYYYHAVRPLFHCKRKHEPTNKVISKFQICRPRGILVPSWISSERPIQDSSGRLSLTTYQKRPSRSIPVKTSHKPLSDMPALIGSEGLGPF